MNRVLVAGLAGGIVMFLWGSLTHLVLPLGEIGFRTAADEEALIGALRDGLREPGLYMVPGLTHDREPAPEEMEAWQARYRRGPTALVVYQPTGDEPFAPRQLLTELGGNVLAVLIAAYVLSHAAAASVGVRILIAGMLGLFTWTNVNLSYWNWYRFPGSFAAAALVDELGGWLLVGVVLALIVRPRPA